MQIIPNKFPTIEPNTSKRIAFVGEAPDSQEALNKECFTNTGGRMLKGVLSSLGVAPSMCFFGNICQTVPPNNDTRRYDDTSEPIQLGFRQLRKDLAKFKPNVVVSLGATPLRLLGINHSVFNYRGSMFWSLLGYKTVATVKPTTVFRNYEYYPLFCFDLKRACTEASSPKLYLPKRTIIHEPDFFTAYSYLEDIIHNYTEVGFDVEGYPDEKGVTVLSFSKNPHDVMCVPLRRFDGTSVYTLDEEVLLWEKIRDILTSKTITKVCQNGLYERFIIQWAHKITIQGPMADTMFAHFELYPEFKSNLGLQTSIYTREPYFKDGRKDKTDKGHWIYNAKDSAVTQEIIGVQKSALSKSPDSYRAYEFKLALQRPYSYMALRGCKLDVDFLNRKRKDVFARIRERQDELMLKVTDGLNINVKSTDQKVAYLYGYVKPRPAKPTDSWLVCEQLARISPKLPEKRDRVTGNLTSSSDAMLEHYARTGNENLRLILRQVKNRTLFSDINKLTVFPDGRIRSSFGPVGPVTGRSFSRESSVPSIVPAYEIQYKGSEITMRTTRQRVFLGTNLQNVTKELRAAFIADDDHIFFQYDLAGADAWTVAADLHTLGYPQMLSDLKRGIKPAKVILLMIYEGIEKVMRMSDEELYSATNELNADKDPLYVCSKACQHGTNYGMKAGLLRLTVIKRSFGDINKPKTVFEQLQQNYELKYNVSARRTYVENLIRNKGVLTTPSGSQRRLLSIRNRRNPTNTEINECLSHEPQNTTTYVTNRANYNLYYMPENRTSDGRFYVEPLLTIHDALCGQWHRRNHKRALCILKKAFDIPIVINKVHLTIPADGGWGANWLDLPNPL